MSFSRADLDLLDRTAEVDIETRAPDGTAHRATIWVVVDGRQVFVRSYLGKTARWYREAVDRAEGAIVVDTRRIPVRVASATDPGSVERTSKGFQRKYRGDPGAKAMVRPDLLDTTLRLEPA